MINQVIKGLQCCQECDGYTCRNCCPYYDRNEPESQPTCTCRLAHDVFALLKAQEPRVMTLEEYEAWIDTPFTERNPVFHEELTKRGAVTSWVNTTVCSLREYGKNDRCWTSRPDKETMEATPWL